VAIIFRKARHINGWLRRQVYTASVFVYILDMTIRMDSLIMTIATALDIVENGLLGASTNHGKRISVLCAKMGKLLGKSQEEITALVVCALLHDNALTESILAERTGSQHDPIMKKHCEYGQRNVDALHLKTSVKDIIRYHHERADGKGPFGIRAGEGPLEAELLAIADAIDVAYHPQRMEPEKLPAIQEAINKSIGKRYSKTAAELMLEALDLPTLASLNDDSIQKSVAAAFLPWSEEIEAETIFGLACFVSKIIDCKSVFTQLHSSQIANRAWFMSGYYNYGAADRVKLYLAAALHDIGKLTTPTEILEKPGRLTNTEFSIMRDHVRMTWELLKDIEGFQDIGVWAADHHEKLDGSGYPHGKNADELDFNSRLMGCIDIYQAVNEERPYHPGRTHEDTMRLLRGMADAGKIDAEIVKDLDAAFAPYDGQRLPPPETPCS